MSVTPVEKAAGLLVAARRVVVLTGAGISTPSGIPDFRSPEAGLWQQADPEVVASLAGFMRDPRAFGAWLRPLAQQIIQAQPNPAHCALAEMERAGLVRAVVTQNIDGLHQKAGSQRVLELHGSLRTATCVDCRRQVSTAGLLDSFLSSGEMPRCAHCGGTLKPDIVLYGEMLPLDVLREAEEEAKSCDLILVVGSSLTVTPASHLPRWALHNGAHLIIANRTPTELDRHAAILFREDVAEVLPAIAQACVALAG